MHEIRVTVKLYSTLKRHVQDYDHSTGIVVDLPKDANAGDLIDSLGLPTREARIVMIGNVRKKRDDELADGDSVHVFGLIGGG